MEDKQTGFPKGRLEKVLIRMVPAWENRADSEHEQAVIRLLVGIIAATYILYAVISDLGEPPYLIISLIIAFFIVAISIVISLIKNPGINPSRRVYGCITDNVSATAALYLNGDLTAPVFIVYLWVTFGNGFRFGKRYLFLSMTLSILGFGSVLLLSDSWTADSQINIGLMLGLIALPLYVASLLGNLERALVDAQAASKAKSDFLATMSHEIRTPLNGLIGILNLLDETGLQGKQHYYVELMKNSSAWLLNVISDGLDFTKIEAGELVIDPAPVDVKATVLSICNIYKAVTNEKGIGFRQDLSSLSAPYVQCDPNRFAQVLNNLLSNACKFTDNGEVVVEVGSSELSDGRVRLLCRVSDTGVGISVENFESIFVPFKQIRGVDSNLPSGTGLGMAISSRLVKLMGGAIQVESSPHVGTTFSFYIDVPVVSEKDMNTQKEQMKTIQWQRSPRILLVEDNAINLEVAETYLHKLGCEVFVATNGLEAIVQVKKNDFDLIFMDCQMPKMDGYEASREIRSIENDVNEKKNVIIALTAHVTNRDREKCYEAGMNDYMGKPYNIDMLQRCLSKWLVPILLTEDVPVAQDVQFISEQGKGNGVEKYYQVDQNSIHDLRNALGGVIGGVELAMIAKDDPAACLRHLQTALKGARQAVAISTELSWLQDDAVGRIQNVSIGS